MDANFREKLIAHCSKLIQEKLDQIQLSMDLAQDSLVNDTKSSAGDKYETSREMIQQDLDRLQKQLSEAKRDQQTLQSIIDLPAYSDKEAKHARLGSLVTTEVGVYFLGVGLGKVVCEGQTIFAISLQSPIGKLILGKQQGESFSFQQGTQTIKALV
ncbi:hypothetical protein ACFSQ3_07750 [Sphingobacterium corticis]|uniref:3-oxoacyl-ACP synthase n=1 Tax=Sphingobacterium corticis TaxID=1812823 RepID=A0ABW5NLD0_9SPHI